MGSVIAKGTKLYLVFKDPSGKRVWRATGLGLSERKKATEALAIIERQTTAQRDVLEGCTDPGQAKGLTVAAFAAWWLDRRTNRSKADDRTRIERHALPYIGHLAMAEVRPRHLMDLVAQLQSKKHLAPRSVRHVYGTLAVMFRQAVKRDVIVSSPAVLGRGDLPKIVDADPEWRDTAIFERAECAALIYDLRVLPDRRVLYALKYLAALRNGEAAGLRWSDVQPAEPLPKLHVRRSYDGVTKTGIARVMAVHPDLAEVLESWKARGWREVFGREPEPGDYVVPTRVFGMRNRKDAQDALDRDLVLLGLRHRRGHDLRRSLISHAQEDGALPHVLKLGTHGEGRDIMSQYTTISWSSRCAELLKLRRLPQPKCGSGVEAVEAAEPTAEKDKGPGHLLSGPFVALVTPPGIEPGFET